MRNENHHQRHHFYHQNLHIHHRSTFLPMLCSRPSIRDVSLPRCRDRSASSSDDALSPRIGCMGQVKRNNKIAGLPTSHRFSLSLGLTTKSNAATTSSTSPVGKYSKLKRLFSGKNFGTAATTAAAATSISSCGSRQRMTANGADAPKNHRCRNENFASISIDDMDPPLPVMKRVQKMEEGNQVDSLWKRRSGGAALKSLQLQQIQHSRHHLLQPTTV